ncbi:hypothetical protein [Methylibium rhizosphaerae]|uniref:hypothetical protein n=1 Tax=Methylibium rhizosphaerae TaxID=2570323 RepID=UPI0015E2DA8F|nr:hypothetical protein [Methylibium rhizosphaerae]
MCLSLQPGTLARLSEMLGEAGGEVWAALLIDASGRQSLASLPNLSARTDAFIVSRAGWQLVRTHAADRRLRIAALVHSHPRGTGLSRADRKGLERSTLPWIIVAAGPGGIDYAVHAPPPS